jgi:hypothetical protein
MTFPSVIAINSVIAESGTRSCRFRAQIDASLVGTTFAFIAAKQTPRAGLDYRIVCITSCMRLLRVKCVSYVRTPGASQP